MVAALRMGDAVLMRMWRVVVMAAVLAGPAWLLTTPAVAAVSGDQVVAEINRLRADPAGYTEELRAYRKLFRGRVVADGNPGGTLTREGVKAVDEAIRALERQPALPPLQGSRVLAAAAQDHVDDQGPRGLVGHQSASGATPSQRVVARGGGPYISETISYGSTSARAVVRQLVVDDGVADRGHRKALLAIDLRYAGAGCGPHAGYTAMCVVDFGRTVDGRPR
jgi:uncharacterized protein YkwD